MRGSGDPDEEQEYFPSHDSSQLGPGLAVDLVLLQGSADPGSVDWTSSLFLGSSGEARPLKVVPEEKARVKVLVERVVQLVRDGVTGMDLLEVFLGRRIQPLQARDHPMWMYSGLEDSTRIHPEDVSEDTLEKWLMGITSNKDNPRGSRRVIPFDNSHQPEQV